MAWTVTAGAAPPSASQRHGHPALIIDSVSKTFRVPKNRVTTLKERALHPLRRTVYSELRAVQDVSLEVFNGEFFGIVGRNGSGKSTLLKCIAGIYRVDRGRIVVAGTLSPFIELGVGFNPDLNARDNVIINAMMLGLSRREALRRFDRIVDFAELHDFMDMRLKNYSSGMMVRLAFATAIQVEADILLIDEVLAVGDAAFQQKCFDQFFQFKREGKTIVFVTHDMHAVERFCDRAMLIDKGRLLQIGDPHTIARAYHKINFGHLPHTPPAVEALEISTTKILGAWFENSSGERVTSISQEEPFFMCYEVEVGEPLLDPVFAATLRNDIGHTIIVARSDRHGHKTGRFEPREKVVARFGIPNWLHPGQYLLTPSLARGSLGVDALALVEDMASVVVEGSAASSGILEVPVSIEISREGRG